MSPGQARALSISLPGRIDPGDAIPIWVVAGRRPGPRVTVVAAPRGFEIAAARAAVRLRLGIDPAAVSGSIVVVPVLRPGGRFAARGQPVPEAAAWRFPGDPGGNRRAREAFAVFSELSVASSVLILLTAPDPGRAAGLTVRGNLDDPRVRLLALQARTLAAVHVKRKPGTLAAAAAEMGVAVLELSGPVDDAAGAGIDALVSAVRGVLCAAGALAFNESPAPARPPTITRLTVVRAPTGGLLDNVVGAGEAVERGALLARIVPPLGERAIDIRAPHDSFVVETGTRSGVRARATLFVLGRVSHAVVTREKKRSGICRPLDQAAITETPKAADLPLRVGWVERISLPALGVERLRAKIDTGARTSALHVTRMKTVGTSDGPHRRPILEVTLPGGSRRGAAAVAVRVIVRDYVQVKDTSGRTERRPVIETTLRLGTLERRIRVTLTNRGDMRFPMLIGRTALGPGVVVDPSRRVLLA